MANNMSSRQACHAAHRVAKRGVGLILIAEAHPILARQGQVRQLDRLVATDHLLVEPVPATALELEVDHEMQHDAFIDGFFKAAVEDHAEFGRQAVSVLGRPELGVADGDLGRARRQRQRRQQEAGGQSITDSAQARPKAVEEKPAGLAQNAGQRAQGITRQLCAARHSRTRRGRPRATIVLGADRRLPVDGAGTRRSAPHSPR